MEQAKHVAKPTGGKTEFDEIRLYNSMVMGMQNYYQIATNVNLDCAKINRAVMAVFTNRLKTQKETRLRKTGRALTKVEKEKYGKSKMLRYVVGTDEPIYPIGYVQHKHPMSKKRSICNYAVEGRMGLHDNLRVNVPMLLSLMRQPLYGRSVEYADNRVSLFSAQWGKCVVTRREFKILGDIHCHHRIPKSNDGMDKYGNLVLVLEPVHKLIHAIEDATITKYLEILNLERSQLTRVNEFRKLVGLDEIA